MSTGLTKLQSRERGLTRTNQAAMRIFKKGAGRELNADEFDEAMVWCEMCGANPIARDIYFFVFDKAKDTRRMVPVLSIGLYRKIADRTGNYRPDDKPARFTYDETRKSEANPAGIVDCEVTIYKHSHGEWHPVTERIKWEERAPIVWEQWQGPRGQRQKVKLDKPILDEGKSNWRTMPETMLAKCVEAAALRKAWPEEMAGTYGEGELDRAEVLELTATEVLHEADKADRLERVGMGMQVDFCDGEPLQLVKPGEFADRVMAFIDQHAKADDLDRIKLFAQRNAVALRQFWAQQPNDALEIKKAIERSTS
jgi:phage recombination protein Bet